MPTVSSGYILSIPMLQAAFPNWKCSCQNEEGTFSSCQHCRTPKGSQKCGRKELSRGRSTEHLHRSHFTAGGDSSSWHWNRSALREEDELKTRELL